MVEADRYVWLVRQRGILSGCKTRWTIATTAGVHFTKLSAVQCALRFQNESIGWEFKARRYTLG